MEQAPYHIPPIFSNGRLVFYGIFPPGVTPKKDATVTIKAKNNKNDFLVTVPLESPIINGKHIHQLAAKSLIRV